MKRLFLLFSLFVLGSCAEAKQEGFSAEINSKDVAEVTDAVAQWQIAHHHEFERAHGDWTHAAFFKGISQWAKYSEQDYYPFLIAIGEETDWNMLGRVYHADDLCIGQMYFDIFKKDGDRHKVAKVLERLDYVVANPSPAPLLKSDKVGRSDRWSWCDALFMAPPVYAAAYTLTGEKKYLDFMNAEFKECTDSLYDVDAQLYYRDNMRKPVREANGAKQFWARGNGWVMGGLPLIIENLPENEPVREYYIELFKELSAGVLGAQDEVGSWHASLLDPASYPTPENSASSFFCYAFAWGIRHGYLDKATYQEPMERAWAALVSAVSTEGKLGFIQPIGASPDTVTKDSNHVYGAGAFLLAGSELYLLSQGK